MARGRLPEEIAEGVQRMSLQDQLRVRAYIQALVNMRPRGTPGTALLRLAGTLGDEDAREMSEAIQTGCEQVGRDGW